MDLLPQNNRRRTWMVVRIVVDVLVVGLVLVAPWWVGLTAAIVAMVALDARELVVAGVLLDAIHSSGLTEATKTEFMFTIVLLLVLSATWFLRQRIRSVV